MNTDEASEVKAKQNKLHILAIGSKCKLGEVTKIKF